MLRTRDLKTFLAELSDEELVQWDQLLESGISEPAAQTALRPHNEVFAPDEVMMLRKRDRVTQADVKTLSTFPKLRAVSLAYCTLPYTDLEPLAGLKRLEVLELPGLKGSSLASASRGSPGLEWLDALPNLRRLDLSFSSPLSQAAWSALEGCQNLMDLRLCYLFGHAQATWLPSVLKLPTLHSLDASCTSLDDEGLVSLLEALPNLRVLEMSETKVTTAGTKHLAGRPWQRLQHFTDFDEDTLARLEQEGSWVVRDDDADFDFDFPEKD